LEAHTGDHRPRSGIHHEATSSRAFTFGSSDLRIFDSRTVIRDSETNFHLSDAMAKVVFTFCHESDLHVNSDDPQFIARVKLDWEERGIAGGQREGGPT
jgi:hypothetical protein